MALPGVELGIQQKPAHADHAVERRAYLVTHGAKEFGLGAIRRLGRIPGLAVRLLGLLALGIFRQQGLLEFVAFLLLALQGIRHLVESDRQIAELAGCPNPRPVIELSGSDDGGGLLQLPDRTDYSGGQSPRQQKCHRDRKYGEEQLPTHLLGRGRKCRIHGQTDGHDPGRRTRFDARGDARNAVEPNRLFAGRSDLDVMPHDRIIGHVLADQIGSIEVADDDTLAVCDPDGTSRRQARRSDNLADAVQPRPKVDDAPHDAGAVKHRTRYDGNPIIVRPAFERIAHRDASFKRRLEEAAISREDRVSVDHRPLGHSDVATVQIERQDVVRVSWQIGLDGP